MKRERGDAVWCAVYAAAWVAEYERNRAYFGGSPRFVPAGEWDMVRDEESDRLRAMVLRAEVVADAELAASQAQSEAVK